MTYFTEFSLKMIEDSNGNKYFKLPTSDDYLYIPTSLHRFVPIFKSGLINATAIGLILNLYMNLSLGVCISLVVLVYIILIVILNKKFIPKLKMTKLNPKALKTQSKDLKSKSILIPVIFILIGIGLIISAYFELNRDLAYYIVNIVAIYAVIKGSYDIASRKY